MKKIYENKKISDFSYFNPSLRHTLNSITGRRILSKKEFYNCVFYAGLIQNTSVRNRVIIEDIILKNCELKGFDVEGPIIKNVVVDGLKTNRLHHLSGAAFQHVVLRGKIGRIIISPFRKSNKSLKKWNKILGEANNNFYKKIDWALDISEADFEDCDIRGIPSRLIRMNPKTQIAITREKAIALQKEWKLLNLSGTYFVEVIDSLIQSDENEKILIALKESYSVLDYDAQVRGIKMLREIGFGSL